MIERFQQMRNAAQQKGKVVPSIEELEAMVPHDMRCHHCEKRMYWTKEEHSSGRVASLQHYKDGTMSIVCLSCNARMGYAPDDVIPPDGHKRCYVCNLTKELDAFHNDTSRRDGKTYRCKACIRDLTKSKEENV